MSHTPGPWTIEADSKSSIWAGGHYVAETYTDHEANARLIAAAPDLLEALFRIGKCLTNKGDDCNVDEDWIWRTAQQAIAKATGEPSHEPSV